MRSVIYTRVSQDKREGRSVAEQESECRAVCEREGWEVVRVFTENDRSASKYAKKERPQYAKLLAFIEARGCDVLVTWEASRAQRDLGTYVELRDACAKAEVLWSYSGKTNDLSRSDDQFTTGLDALLAERESNVTRDRILRSTRQQASAGMPHGKRLFGYRRTYDPESGRLVAPGQVPDPMEAAIVLEAVERFSRGESLHAIAKDLNGRGITTPKGGEWTGTQVRRAVANPAYVAKRVHRGQIVGNATWEPIVPEDVWLSCQARLADPARTTDRGEYRRKWLLSGIAVCGVCGGRIRVGRPRGISSYVCSKGFCVARKVEPVDAYVIAHLLARLGEPDVLDAFRPVPVERVNPEVAHIEAQLAVVASLDADAREAAERPLLARLEALQVPPAGIPPLVLEAAADPAGVWDRLSLDQRRELVRLVLAEVRIDTTTRGTRSLDLDTEAGRALLAVRLVPRSV